MPKPGHNLPCHTRKPHLISIRKSPCYAKKLELISICKLPFSAKILELIDLCSFYRSPKYKILLVPVYVESHRILLLHIKRPDSQIKWQTISEYCGTLPELPCGTSFRFLAYPIKPWPFLALSDKTDFYLCSSTLLHNFFSSHGHPVCRTVACWHLNAFMISSSWKNFTMLWTFFLTEKFSCSTVQGSVTSHTFLVTDFTSTWK